MMLPATLKTTGQLVYVDRVSMTNFHYVVFVPFTREELLKRRNPWQLWHPARMVKKSKIVFQKGVSNENISKAA